MFVADTLVPWDSCQKVLLPYFSTDARQVRSCLASGEPFLALVEETGRGVAGFLVISDDFNVRRRQQEDLVGHALDASAQTEDKAGGKVDQPLSVRLPHVRHVHDDRDAVTEAFADQLGVIVGARVDRGDLPQSGGFFAAGRRTLDGCHGCAVFLFGSWWRFTGDLSKRRRCTALFTVLLHGVVLVLLLGGKLRLVVFIAVGEPKIDHCLAQSASHGRLLIVSGSGPPKKSRQHWKPRHSLPIRQTLPHRRARTENI